MNEFLLIGGMFAVTFLTRYPMMLLVSRIEVPAQMTQAFRYVPIAVLSAIIAPIIFVQDGQISIQINNHFLLAALISVFISWRTRNLLLTIVLGMLAFILLRAVLI
jgi:branched-subunit amino acid transport protein